MWWPVAVETAALAWALGPFIRHRIDMGRWAAGPLNPSHHEPPTGQSLTVLLPVWNETAVIERKLSNLAEQDVRLDLHIIDSASNDDTVERARAWLTAHPDAFDGVTVDVMPRRLGKSAAVVRALEDLANREAGLVCMTDADAMLAPGTLVRLMTWFNDPMVGVVGAVPDRFHARQEERQHRDAWEAMRLAESAVDSTPFLEGSCMMWRSTLLTPQDVVTYANADDAQIATAIRCKGRRSIADAGATFTDVAPLNARGQRRQKVRRGQGLQRLLMRRRADAGHNKQGVFGRIFRRQHHFHIVAPLLLAVASVAATVRWGLVLAFGWPESSTTAAQLHLAATGMEAIALLAWFGAKQGRSWGPLTLLGQWLISMTWLMQSLMMLAKGRSLHVWEQHRDERMLNQE